MADLTMSSAFGGSELPDDNTPITPDVMAALGLRPTSASLVKLLKETSRVDAAAKLLTKLLETYRANESASKAGVGKQKERTE